MILYYLLPGDPKRTLNELDRTYFLKANAMNTNKVSACRWKASLSFRVLRGQFKKCVLSEKIVSKICKFIYFLDHSLAVQSIFWKVWKKLNSNFVLELEIWKRNRGQSFYSKQQISPRRLLIHRYVEFSQNVDSKMMAIISLKLRSPEFEIFIESGFSDGNHCLKWPCSISKDS